MKKGRVSHCCCVGKVVILWMGRYLKWLPTPKAIHNSCNSNCFAYAIASNTTLASTLLSKTFLRPLADACFTWMTILESASSWFSGANTFRLYWRRAEHVNSRCSDYLHPWKLDCSQAFCLIVKRLIFVFIRSPKVLPGDWNGCIIAHTPSYSRASRLPCTLFQTVFDVLIP